MTTMTDNQASLLGLALVAGLFVAYGVERRKKRLERARPRADASPGGTTPVVRSVDAAGAPSEPTATADTTVPLPGDHPTRSLDAGCLPLLNSFLLFLVAGHRHDGWGYLWQALFFALAAFAAWSALVPSEYAKASRSDPGLSRRAHVLRTGVPFVVLPLIGWGLVVPVGWDPGFLLPALPWLLAAAYAYVASAFSRK